MCPAYRLLSTCSRFTTLSNQFYVLSHKCFGPFYWINYNWFSYWLFRLFFRPLHAAFTPTIKRPYSADRAEDQTSALKALIDRFQRLFTCVSLIKESVRVCTCLRNKATLDHQGTWPQSKSDLNPNLSQWTGCSEYIRFWYLLFLAANGLHTPESPFLLLFLFRLLAHSSAFVSCTRLRKQQQMPVLSFSLCSVDVLAASGWLLLCNFAACVT